MSISSAAARYSPERAAGRSSVLRELIEVGLAIDAAEHWCAAWEAEARRQGLRPSSPHFWDAGRGWIDAQRSFLTSAR
jgi:hypothetical protein